MFWRILPWASYLSFWLSSPYHNTMIRNWSLVAFSGLILWQWGVGCRCILGNLSKYTKGAYIFLLFFLWSAIYWAGVDAVFPLLHFHQNKHARSKVLVFDDDVLIIVCHFWFIMVCFRGHCQHNKRWVEWQNGNCKVTMAPQAVRDTWKMYCCFHQKQLSLVSDFQSVTI